MKKVLTNVFVIVFALLFTYTCFLGNAALSWSSEMADMTHFDLGYIPTSYGAEPLRFYTDAGLCYEAVEVPDGITRDMLTDNLSWEDYDEIITSEWDMEYRVYRDPLQTGENYVLIVPDVAGFNRPLATTSRPLGYYAKEVPKA